MMPDTPTTESERRTVKYVATEHGFGVPCWCVHVAPLCDNYGIRAYAHTKYEAERLANQLNAVGELVEICEALLAEFSFIGRRGLCIAFRERLAELKAATK